MMLVMTGFFAFLVKERSARTSSSERGATTIFGISPKVRSRVSRAQSVAGSGIEVVWSEEMGVIFLSLSRGEKDANRSSTSTYAA